MAYTAKANDSVTRFRLQDIVFALSTLTKAIDTNAVNLLVTDRVCESRRGFLQLWAAEVCLTQPEKASAFDV